MDSNVIGNNDQLSIRIKQAVGRGSRPRATGRAERKRRPS
jgi:hypothetical protein